MAPVSVGLVERAVVQGEDESRAGETGLYPSVCLATIQEGHPVTTISRKGCSFPGFSLNHPFDCSGVLFMRAL